ncbi:hypothetical protein ABW20_dc0106559 [Dactylellina cionopaga]|nr:hypothetical protein ABW20_dc0106559 [Dactylellina cionopaga]
MGIPLWESPPDAKTLDKASATNRCDIHTTTAHASSGTSTRIPPPSTARGSGSLAYDYIYSGSRPIRRHILDSSSSDTIEIEDLQNEREHESQIRERERERDLSARMERSRRERGERRSAHMERFLNANYHTPQLPTTSTTSQRSRPHMIQPNTDQLLTLSEFLREAPTASSSSQPRSSNTAQTPSTEISTLHQLLGIRGSGATRNSGGERRDIQAWERAVSAAGIPPSLTPATTALSTSNAAATISNPPPAQRRSASIPNTEWPPTSPPRSTSPNARAQDSFQTLVNQIRRIGALQDYMLNSVDETAASLEESLSLHSQALNQALNSPSQPTTTTSTNSAVAPSAPSTLIPDINSQNYFTSLRVREARIRTMQSRIDLLASEFALLRSTRRELRRAENEAINMFQSAGVTIPTPTSSSTAATTTAAAVSTSTSTAMDILTTVSPQTILPQPQSQDPLRTEVDEVDEALDAEGNSSRRVLRSTFLPAELGDEALFRHFENAENRARVRERLAGVRRELEAEQARSTEIIQEQRRRMAEALAGSSIALAGATMASERDREREEDDGEGGRRRRRGHSIGSLDRSQSERRA